MGWEELLRKEQCMLDILDSVVCDNRTMKKILSKHIGTKVFVEYNLGRNKIEKYCFNRVYGRW